eukprot:TRINITY_DN16819_c0_g1_i1.p1 TRINITY_DN16819_c0_g1~~TRINITY_DN16819_c0_g1_i1.p1  ORF type:complete len:312 (+),score=36.78 TRINITY_DN16819_c0_g1_i1:46-981(+)
MSEADLMAPFNHIANVPGKGFRSKMIEAFNVWLQVEEEKIKGVKSIVDKLHTSSLVIDDIEDNSQLRRGVPVAHSIYGIAATINSANYVYFLALQEAIKLVPREEDVKSRELLEAFTEEMCNLHRGQGRDIHFRDSSVVPSEEQYLSMVMDKTGGLFRLTVKLMQLFSRFDGDFTVLLNKMGAYFQILDDYLNLQSFRYHKSKTFCEDITEGKYSFPIIHSIHEYSKLNDDRLHKIIRKCPESEDLKKYALSLMSKTESFSYTKTALSKLYNEIVEEIATIGPNPPLLKLMEKLHSQIEEQDDVTSDGFGF